MCMKYKGVIYGYAFTFIIPIEDGNDREFNIAISNYRVDSKDYSGLCLENELRVISEERMLFAAFVDIIENITKITVDGEKNLCNSYPGIKPAPLLNVQDSEFHRKFAICKESKKSLDYYEKLRLWFERQESFPDEKFIYQERENPKPKRTDLFICLEMINFKEAYPATGLPFKGIEYFPLHEGGIFNERSVS